MNIFIAHVTGQKGELTEEESWHCSRVLRKKSGDHVTLIDGEGNFYEAVMDLVSDRKCTVRITHGPMLQPAPSYYLHLAIAPTKQVDRIEWMVEKAVEIGIQQLSFFTSQNSERVTLKSERLIKIVQSAVKQSLHARIPLVNELRSFKDLIKHGKADNKLIAHCMDLAKKPIRTVTFKDHSTLVLIGPEGDFSPEEVSQAIEKGFEGVSLGETRLRTETAGLYVCQAASILSL